MICRVAYTSYTVCLLGVHFDQYKTHFCRHAFCKTPSPCCYYVHATCRSVRGAGAILPNRNIAYHRISSAARERFPHRHHIDAGNDVDDKCTEQTNIRTVAVANGDCLVRRRQILASAHARRGGNGLRVLYQHSIPRHFGVPDHGGMWVVVRVPHCDGHNRGDVFRVATT